MTYRTKMFYQTPSKDQIPVQKKNLKTRLNYTAYTDYYSMIFYL